MEEWPNISGGADAVAFLPPHVCGVVGLREDVVQEGHAGAEEINMVKLGAHLEVIGGDVSLEVFEGDEAGLGCGGGGADLQTNHLPVGSRHTPPMPLPKVSVAPDHVGVCGSSSRMWVGR